MTQTVEELMNSFKKLREFVIAVEVPEGKTLDGFIPAAANPTKGLFKLYATSLEEAKRMVTALIS